MWLVILFKAVTALAFNKKIPLTACALNILEIFIIQELFCFYQGCWDGVVFFVSDGFS